MTSDQIALVQQNFVKVEHYPVVSGEPLWSPEKGLGEAWTPEVASAWTSDCGTLSGYMISEASGRFSSRRMRIRR